MNPALDLVAQSAPLLLKGAGYTVLEGCDGKDAIAKLTGQKVNLIISDVNMPNMDGITFVRELKTRPAYKFTPVMMLTTESQEEKKAQGQAAGSVGRRLPPSAQPYRPLPQGAA